MLQLMVEPGLPGRDRLPLETIREIVDARERAIIDDIARMSEEEWLHVLELERKKR